MVLEHFSSMVPSKPMNAKKFVQFVGVLSFIFLPKWEHDLILDASNLNLGVRFLCVLTILIIISSVISGPINIKGEAVDINDYHGQIKQVNLIRAG